MKVPTLRFSAGVATVVAVRTMLPSASRRWNSVQLPPTWIITSSTMVGGTGGVGTTSCGADLRTT